MAYKHYSINMYFKLAKRYDLEIRNYSKCLNINDNYAKNFARLYKVIFLHKFMKRREFEENMKRFNTNNLICKYYEIV